MWIFFKENPHKLRDSTLFLSGKCFDPNRVHNTSNKFPKIELSLITAVMYAS